jgi:hypothetical protein
VFVESHPRRSPNSFLSLTPIPRPLPPNSDISHAALSPCSAIPVSLLESALADKHRVLPVFSCNRPHLSSLECALVSHLISVDSKQLTGTLNPLDATLTKNTGVPHSSQISFSPPASGPSDLFRTIPCLFTLLRTLLRAAKTQLLSFQAIPHSLPKTTRGGRIPGALPWRRGLAIGGASVGNLKVSQGGAVCRLLRQFAGGAGGE